MLNIILHTPPLAGLPDQLVLAVPHGSQVCLDEDGAISRRCHIEEGAHVRKVRKSGEVPNGSQVNFLIGTKGAAIQALEHSIHNIA
jgi:hypothetical protein